VYRVRNPWLGLDSGADPVGLARLLMRAHEEALAGAPTPSIIRDVVTRSWERSQLAGVDPEHHEAPQVHERREIAERWRNHPLSRFAPLIREHLCDFAYDARHIVVVGDADGCLLWSAGHPSVLAASEEIAFVPGRLWREEATGTNGVGTAIAVDHPVQIFSAEHFNRAIHGWTCSGAPVHDPETGRVLGVIDLSSGIRAAHPHSLALVTATARMVEARLDAEAMQRRERLRARFFERVARGARGPCALVDRTGHVLASHPQNTLAGRLEAVDGGWRAAGGERLESEPLGDGAQLVHVRVRTGRPRSLHLRGLGRDTVEARIGGQRLVLPRRRSEILVLLALHPEGLTAEKLARELYGDVGKRMSVRSEMSRLRRQLGGMLAANPYRLLADVHADFLEPPWARDGGLLLPGSVVPAIVAAREELASAV
jgi:GAF domain